MRPLPLLVMLCLALGLPGQEARTADDVIRELLIDAPYRVGNQQYDSETMADQALYDATRHSSDKRVQRAWVTLALLRDLRWGEESLARIRAGTGNAMDRHATDIPAIELELAALRRDLALVARPDPWG